MDLLHDLKRRNLKMDHPILVVIDGSPALHCAVEDVVGDLVQIQRCRQHKCENVKKYLPKEYHAEYERKIKAAYAMNSYDDVRSALTNVIRELGRVNISAAESLEEGFRLNDGPSRKAGLEAEKRFRKVRGYKFMSVLIAALEVAHRSSETQERLAA
jgi:hypothetical protein